MEVASPVIESVLAIMCGLVRLGRGRLLLTGAHLISECMFAALRCKAVQIVRQMMSSAQWTSATTKVPAFTTRTRTLPPHTAMPTLPAETKRVARANSAPRLAAIPKWCQTPAPTTRPPMCARHVRYATRSFRAFAAYQHVRSVSVGGRSCQWQLVAPTVSTAVVEQAGCQ